MIPSSSEKISRTSWTENLSKFCLFSGLGFKKTTSKKMTDCDTERKLPNTPKKVNSSSKNYKELYCSCFLFGKQKGSKNLLTRSVSWTYSPSAENKLEPLGLEFAYKSNVEVVEAAPGEVTIQQSQNAPFDSPEK